MKRILVIAAHPDDEILGCGGAIARFATTSCEVHIMILAEGLTSRDHARNREKRATELTTLAQTAKQAGELAGAARVELLDFPDNRMDSLDLLDVVKPIERKIVDFSPDTIFTHCSSDLNIDHRITSQAVITASRPYPGQSVKNVLFFEVPSSTEWQFGAPAFTPNFFIPLSEDELEKKLAALKIYEGEMRPFPHARSLEAVQALARWRGASIGAAAAEGFISVRTIL